MHLKSAKFYKSISQSSQLFELEKPVMAVLGRSNSGKSSLLNSLLGQNLARTGQTPGVTKLINLFEINNAFYLADLPGYGFAQMSKSDQKELQDLIYWFLTNEENQLKHLFLLIDSRVGPTSLDQQTLQFMGEHQIPVTIIASKYDKLKNSERSSHLKKIKDFANLYEVIPYSSETGEGQKELLNRIFSLL